MTRSRLEADGTIDTPEALVVKLLARYDDAEKWLHRDLAWTDAIVINFAVSTLHGSMSHLIYRDFRRSLEGLSKAGIEHGIAAGISLGLLVVHIKEQPVAWKLRVDPALVALWEGSDSGRLDQSPVQPLGETLLGDIVRSTVNPPRTEAGIEAGSALGLLEVFIAEQPVAWHLRKEPPLVALFESDGSRIDQGVPVRLDESLLDVVVRTTLNPPRTVADVKASLHSGLRVYVGVQMDRYWEVVA
jgi:hypothetical protein